MCDCRCVNTDKDDVRPLPLDPKPELFLEMVAVLLDEYVDIFDEKTNGGASRLIAENGGTLPFLIKRKNAFASVDSAPKAIEALTYIFQKELTLR